MFHVYVLKSRKTSRRYVGSCENLETRVRRHNLGHSKATRVTVSHGLWCIVKRFLLEPMPKERNGIMNQVEVVTNWIYYGCSPVAAATGRGFESRRPES